MALELTADWTAYSALWTFAALAIGFWVIARAVATQPGATAVYATPQQHYLTERVGRTSHLTRAERLRHWRHAANYVVRILRIRKRWAATGHHLQQPRIRDLVAGISRKGGKLTRVSSAAVR